MTLSELIERVEKLDWPSREVDEAIHAATNKPLRAGLRFGVFPTYTASLDKAITLTERMLPGFGISIEEHPVYGDWWDAAIFDRMPKTVANARKQTAALALCLALLRALSAQERDDGR